VYTKHKAIGVKQAWCIKNYRYVCDISKAEYARLKGDTDHNVLHNVGRSLPDQAFDTARDSKKVQVHPTDPDKTTSIAVDLDPT
jgi:hypothetical protein